MSRTRLSCTSAVKDKGHSFDDAKVHILSWEGSLLERGVKEAIMLAVNDYCWAEMWAYDTSYQLPTTQSESHRHFNPHSQLVSGNLISSYNAGEEQCLTVVSPVRPSDGNNRLFYTSTRITTHMMNRSVTTLRITSKVDSPPVRVYYLGLSTSCYRTEDASLVKT